MTIKKASDPIPILLGNDYKGMVKVGDVIDIGFWYYVYPCKVAGILERGASLPENGQVGAGMVQVDSKILFPYGIVQSAEGGNANELAAVFSVTTVLQIRIYRFIFIAMIAP